MFGINKHPAKAILGPSCGSKKCPRYSGARDTIKPEDITLVFNKLALYESMPKRSSFRKHARKPESKSFVFLKNLA